jgi:hypothetical protein
MSSTTSASPPPEDGVRALAIELYQQALDEAIDESKHEPIDTLDVSETAALRLHEQCRFRTLDLSRVAMRGVKGGVERGRAPRFAKDGSTRMRFGTILHVGENVVVAAQYAREDDWLAWLAIHRKNADDVRVAQEGKELGVARIVADLRAAGPRVSTYDVRPDLFEKDEDEGRAHA